MHSGLINNRKCGQGKCFSGISSVSNKNGILITYSAKGEVKRILKACGFECNSNSGSAGEKADDKGCENLKYIFSMSFFAFPKVLSIAKFLNLKNDRMKIKGLIVLPV